MSILHTSGNKPELEVLDLVDEWTGFMNTRKPQKGDRLTEKLLTNQATQAEYARGIDDMLQGLVLPDREGTNTADIFI